MVKCGRMYAAHSDKIMETEVLVREPEREMPQPEVDAETSRLETIRVLLVEDNPSDARLIELMLDKAGGGLIELEHVERLSQALSRLIRGEISVVLSDLSLPDSHGLQTFSRLHAQASDVPIIVLSGLS